MNVRIGDNAVMKSQFANNFIRPEPGNSYPIYLHQQKSIGNNFEVVKSGHIGVKEGSNAQKCINDLIFGCGRIDLLEISGHLIACFRDKKVLVSMYLEIDDTDCKEAIV